VSTDTPSNDIASLMAHLDASVSPRHSVAHVAADLGRSGFSRIDDVSAALPRLGYLERGGLLLAWVRGSGSTFRIAGAHTDSPCLRLKPQPEISQHRWRQWGVEVYGGILNNSWLDRDLGVAGVVVDDRGRAHLVRSPGPVARVPQLAVHLDREVNDRGLILDRQSHLLPVVGTAESPGSFTQLIAQWAGLDASSVVSFDLSLFDVQPAALIGIGQDLLASGRIDNQVSCWAAAGALIERSRVDSEETAVIALFDHEEVGSESTTGASGPWLEWILEALHDGTRSSFHAALAASACLSVDCAHGVHPNYPERHDPVNRPHVDQGPVIKTNANQRYATSAETAALFTRACFSVDVPCQSFVSRNNVACGSTIGPLASTRLGVPTVDVGISQLSMHSARELCGTHDPGMLRRAIGAFFAQR